MNSPCTNASCAGYDEKVSDNCCHYLNCDLSKCTAGYTSYIPDLQIRHFVTVGLEYFRKGMPEKARVCLEKIHGLQKRYATPEDVPLRLSVEENYVEWLKQKKLPLLAGQFKESFRLSSHQKDTIDHFVRYVEVQLR